MVGVTRRFGTYRCVCVCKYIATRKKNKSDLVQTSDAFWQSAHVFVSVSSFKWHSFMFLGYFVYIQPNSQKFDSCEMERQTDGRTHLLIEMRERI